ncbi:MAG: STAS domain-containing protein [Fusobacteriota bacterium]
MSGVESKYLAGEIDNKMFIKIIGNATMKNSKTLEDLFEDLLSKEQEDIILDLSKCNYMDSTMLGLIAKTAIRIKKKWDSTLYILNITNMIRTSFKSTGLDKLVTFLDEDQDIDEDDIDELEMKDFDDVRAKNVHILEAHKTLTELNDENKEAFKSVVDLLEKSLEEQ